MAQANAQDAGAAVFRRPRDKSFLLSVVVPVYNEEEVLREFHDRLAAVLADAQLNAEIVYVNDGSSDRSLEIIRELRHRDRRVAIVDLSRNFGKEIALTAGLDHAKGDAVVVIDADLQDPPELIPQLVQHFYEGYDTVYAQRLSRAGESAIKKGTAYAFYRIIQWVSRVKIPEDTGDYRLLSRRAVEALKQLKEQHRFMKGLFAWIGFPQKAVPYRRDPRKAGQTKWNYWRLWNFALEGITSFTIAPLKAASYVGLVTAIAAFVFAARIIYKTLVYGDPVAGYPSLMVVILFLGGVQLITIGVIGEYLGRMFDETKGRPLYFLKEYTPADASCSAAPKGEAQLPRQASH
ncbi:MAG TPA: glycosyltransferase family 2 protein [Candidatus Acidoferrales bacterium]|nr:glycosyltransferase family 2 protein [Candidatus Acidoferrales bacterium]